MKYLKPEFELFELDDEDVIATSNLTDGGNPDETIPGGWSN